MNKNKQPTKNLFDLTVNKILFDDDIKTLDVFTPFAHTPWSMWLDSCETKHIDCRFDILVFEPLLTLSTFGEHTQVTALHEKTLSIINASHTGEVKTFQEDPLSLVDQLSKRIFGDVVTKHQTLPFIGGALGYFAYDLGRQFEKVPTKAKQDISLADMAVGLYHQEIIFDKNAQCYWLVCPENERITLEKTIHARVKNTLSLHTSENSENFTLSSEWQSNMCKASYAEKFDKVQDYLLSGDCYQINLAQRFQAQYQGDEFDAYKSLRKENKAPFSGFIRLKDSTVLSLSPERFLQTSEGYVQSKPIKGTMPRSTELKEDTFNAEQLKASTKDRAENLMIVDLLRNDMSKVCIAGSVKVPKLFEIESFPAVHHLVSTVEGVLSPDKQATDLLRGAFPGGSITGAPKIRAMQIIEELEPHRRSIYCGSIGYISRCGTMDSSITIRTLVCEKQKQTIYCWAGGGLVADSNVDSEYQETFDKVQRILPVLTGKK